MNETDDKLLVKCEKCGDLTEGYILHKNQKTMILCEKCLHRMLGMIVSDNDK